jgi:hypothetical protein
MESPQKTQRLSGYGPGSVSFDAWKAGFLDVNRATFLARLDLEKGFDGKAISFKKSETLHTAVSKMFADAQKLVRIPFIF